MCQTGGPRCYTEAKVSADRAETDYREAAVALTDLNAHGLPEHESGDVYTWQDAWLAAHNRRDRARTHLLDALGDLAATRQGVDEVRERLHVAESSPITAAELPAILREGEFRRRRGSIARAVRARSGEDALAGIVGKTGDPVIDGLVVAAARRVADEPEQYPGHAHGLPDVIPFSDEGQKAMMVQSWESAVRQKAEQCATDRRRLAEAAHDVALMEQTVTDHPGDVDARARLVSAKTRLAEGRSAVRYIEADLVMTASKLMIAQQQVPQSAAA